MKVGDLVSIIAGAYNEDGDFFPNRFTGKVGILIRRGGLQPSRRWFRKREQYWQILSEGETIYCMVSSMEVLNNSTG